MKKTQIKSVLGGSCCDGISMKWSPINSAYLICWHDAILRIVPKRSEVRWYLANL